MLNLLMRSRIGTLESRENQTHTQFVQVSMMRLLTFALAIALSAPALAQNPASTQTGTSQGQQHPAESGKDATTKTDEAHPKQDEGRKKKEKLDKSQEDPVFKKRSRQADCRGPAALCKQDSAR